MFLDQQSRLATGLNCLDFERVMSSLPTPNVRQRTLSSALQRRLLVVFFLGVGGLVAAAPSPDSAAANILDSLRPGHPRLIATPRDWAAMLERSATDKHLRRIIERLERDGRDLLAQPPLTYQKQGRRLLAVSRAALHRVTLWAFCHRLTGAPAFAQRAEAEMLALSAFPDWNPSHFLDTAEMTAALAIGYDWLHAALAPSTRATVRQAIVEKGLLEAVGPHAQTGNWRRSRNNWNQVCFGGMTLGALAVADEEPALARALLEAARQDIVHGLEPYAPDGVYPEGPGYWHYGTIYQVWMLAALESALGDTWQLETRPGFLSSAAAQLHQTGPTGLAYNFADNPEGSPFTAAMFWFARHLQQPELLAFHARRLDAVLSRAASAESRLPFVALWWNSWPSPEAVSRLPLAWFGDSPNPIGTFRSSWTDPDALYLAFKGGSARLGHAHMDAGSFVLEADGVRWARDLGAQNYHSIESAGWNLWDRSQGGDRWKVYRLNNFSHNTLTIDGQLHRVRGDARIIRFDAEARQATVDLSEIFAGQATRVLRHFQVGKDREVRVDDELEGLTPGSPVRWQMVTRAKVETSGAQATLREAGKVLQARALLPSNATFEVQPADPPDDGVNAPNPGARIMFLNLHTPAEGKLHIRVSLRPGEP
jgi:hypothetical protein